MRLHDYTVLLSTLTIAAATESRQIFQFRRHVSDDFLRRCACVLHLRRRGVKICQISLMTHCEQHKSSAYLAHEIADLGFQSLLSCVAAALVLWHFEDLDDFIDAPVLLLVSREVLF